MNKQAATLKKMVNSKKLKTRVIAVASGKGGVGKSTITVNTALAFQELGYRVFIIDSDIGMANIDILLNLNTRYDLHHILKGICSFEEAIATGPFGLDVLSGISGLDDLVEISNDNIKKLLQAAGKIGEKYDIVMLDTGAGVSQSVINCTTAAGEVIVVLTPEPTSIMDAYSLIKLLSAYSYSGKLYLLINQVVSQDEARQIADRMIKTVNKYLDVDISFLGNIPYENSVSESIKKQSPIFKLYPEKTVNKSFLQITERLTGKRIDNPTAGIKSFIFKLTAMINRRR